MEQPKVKILQKSRYIKFSKFWIFSGVIEGGNLKSGFQRLFIIQQFINRKKIESLSQKLLEKQAFLCRPIFRYQCCRFLADRARVEIRTLKFKIDGHIDTILTCVKFGDDLIIPKRCFQKQCPFSSQNANLFLL